MRKFLSIATFLIMAIIVVLLGIFMGIQRGKNVAAIRNAHSMLETCAKLFETYEYHFVE